MGGDIRVRGFPNPLHQPILSSRARELLSILGNPLYDSEQTESGDAETSPYPSNDYLFRETWDWYTNPTDPDTDDDGLLDCEEISFGTDPNKADTDEDGIKDGEEVE